MVEDSHIYPGEPATPRDPLALVRWIARMARWPALGLVLLLIVLGIVFRRSEQWGDIATWVLAVTTLLAFLAAAFAGLVAYDLLKIETTRDRQAAQERSLAAADRRREHASRISFWLYLGHEHVGRSDSAPPGTEIHITLVVMNTSDRPAMSVMALLGLRADIWRDASTADSNELDERTAEWATSVIPPHDRDGTSHVLNVPASVVRIVEEYGDDALIGELLFTDASGTDWAQTFPDGRIIERRSPAWRDNIHLSLANRDEQRRNPARPDPAS